ncbi:MAG: DNA polymerase III subunit gamma/tau [Anaerolineae bacterium]|nr:DNA polymerase III subunit gamma/tau [Anaerolineae bacterium]
MAQALYRKWRPASFDDVVGQEHVTTTLKNQIATDRIGHAYLFVGSRGCGKTTSARIFAREIGISDLRKKDPARAQQIADAITEGRHLDLIEIDAASHTSVDDIRDLRDKVAYQPSELKYKVYIIDEVHMLSTSAFNALLKTLEEPPPHVIFILATTDPQKIPATVLSRCQRFNFRRVPVAQIVGRLRVLCDGEGIECDDAALTLIARHATGSLRDAVSLLDQLASSNSLRITTKDVRDALGSTDAATVRALVDGMVRTDIAAGLDAIQAAVDQGADARQIARQVIDQLRAVMQVRVSARPIGGSDLSEAEKLDLSHFAEQADTGLLLRGVRAFSTAINDMRQSTDSQMQIELAYLECVTDAAPAASPAASSAAARSTEPVRAAATPATREPQHTCRRPRARFAPGRNSPYSGTGPTGWQPGRDPARAVAPTGQGRQSHQRVDRLDPAVLPALGGGWHNGPNQGQPGLAAGPAGRPGQQESPDRGAEPAAGRDLRRARLCRAAPGRFGR